MIKRGHFIKHERTMDVAFYVLQVFYSSEYIKLKGYWYNQGYVESFQLFPNPTRIKIKNSELNKLLYTTNYTNEKCIRNLGWVRYNVAE